MTKICVTTVLSEFFRNISRIPYDMILDISGACSLQEEKTKLQHCLFDAVYVLVSLTKRWCYESALLSSKIFYA